MYNLSLVVSNGLGQQAAWLQVSVEYPLTAVTLQIPPNVLARPSQLTFIVHGGPIVDFEIDFGDGQTSVISSEGKKVVKSKVDQTPAAQVPVYK